MADNNKVQEQLKEITERLEQGIKEVFENGTYREYLDVMSRFHNYSANNTMLIAMQKPEATFVAGFDAWKTKFGRHVMKGEKAISIIAPNPIKATEELEKLDPVTGEPVLDELGRPVLEMVETTQMTFRVAKVFDVSQTDGRELPDFVINELTGAVEDYDIFMETLKEVSPVPIGFEDMADAYGYYHQTEKRIAIQNGLSELQTMKTTIHEIAHAVLHDVDINTIEGAERKDSRTKEVEAESVAYAICSHYGLDTSNYSFDYIAGWSSRKEVPELKNSLDTIKRTSAGLITAIDEKMKVYMQEKAIAADRSSDVIVKFTYGSAEDAPDPVFKRIENRDREAVGELLEQIVFEVEGELENEIASFLEEQGVIMKSVLDESGNEVKNLRNYDFECDLFYDEVADIKQIFSDRQPIADSDVVVKFTAAMGTNIGYEKITNMSRTDVEKLLERLIEHVDHGFEGAGHDFLTEHGAEIETVLEEWEKDEVFENTFYDFWYDVDTNEVVDSQTLSIREQAEYALNRMEHKGKLFSTEEWESLIDYAERAKDIQQMNVIAKAVAAGDATAIRTGGLHEEQSEPQIVPAAEPEERVELSSKEAPLVYGHDDYFGIYQLKQNEATREYRFESLAHLQEKGLAVEKTNYDLVYQGILKSESLDDIFERFNIDHPDDFRGHSLSISDIVVFRREGETKAHYVDRFGFEEVGDFYRQIEKEPEKSEVAYAVGDKYIAVQTSEEGYDYSLYDHEYALIDGGLLENPDITTEAAAKEIITDLYGDIDLEEVSYDALIEWVEKQNEVRPEPNKETEAGDAKQSISFYVAENGEFHNDGEYHDNLTLQEAIAIYHTIPYERMNAGKTIGFELQTGLEGVFSEVSMELFCFNMIGMDMVEYIECIRGNELIWDAMKELAEAFPDAEIDNLETMERLSLDVTDFVVKYFPEEYQESGESRQQLIDQMKGFMEPDKIAETCESFREFIAENVGKEYVREAQVLLKRLNDIWLRREHNPLTKVEEIEESNYNQIDGMLNNMDTPKDTPKGSIHKRLEQAKETLAQERGEQPPKAASKQREELVN